MGSHFQAAATADDLKTSKLAKAQRDLEEMYIGVPDESVNLTFQHLAHIKQHHVVTHTQTMISPAACGKREPVDMSASNNTLSKLPTPNQYHHETHISSSGASGSNINHARLHLKTNIINSPDPPSVSNMYRHSGAAYYENDDDMMTMRRQYQGTDANTIKQFAMRSPVNSPRGIVAGRQGIPHSKICAICDRHIHVFRHRCLVCGRVYCRNCVNIGMGEMSEGRKCVECLGRKFSQRYIQRAGKTNKWWRFCCCHHSYPDKVKQQELKWAEKGSKVTIRMTQNNDGRSRSSIITMPSSLSSNHDLHNYYRKQNKQQQPSSYHHDNPPSFVCPTPSSPTVSSPYLHF